MRIIKRITRPALMSMLSQSQVPIERWRGGRTNTPDDLWSMINKGEIWMTLQGSTLVLHDNVAVVHVLHEDPLTNVWSELREAFILCADGTIMSRDFTGSIGGKIRCTETYRTAAKREIAEELGVTERGFRDPRNYFLYQFSSEILPRAESEFWPGIGIVHHRKIFACVIADELRREEYVSFDATREFHFKWVPVAF